MIVNNYSGKEGRKSMQKWVNVLYGEEQMKQNFTQQWTQTNHEHERNVVFEQVPASLWAGLPVGHDYDINKGIDILGRTHGLKGRDITTVKFTWVTKKNTMGCNTEES